MDQMPRPIADAPPASQYFAARPRTLLILPAMSSAVYDATIATIKERKTRRGLYSPISIAIPASLRPGFDLAGPAVSQCYQRIDHGSTGAMRALAAFHASVVFSGKREEKTPGRAWRRDFASWRVFDYSQYCRYLDPFNVRTARRHFPKTLHAAARHAADTIQSLQEPAMRTGSVTATSDNSG
ncbi:hypothetical protein WJ968_22695 [Achromobacter xylosoxidans]